MPGHYIDAEWQPPGDFDAPVVPYRAWVPEPISGLSLDVSQPLRRLAQDAADAVSEFAHSGEARLTCGAHVAAEAMASTMIEDIYPSPQNLPAAMFWREGRAQELAAVSNIDAIERALGIGGSESNMTLDDVCAIHAALTCQLPGYRHTPGELRTKQNWIAPFNWMDWDGMRLGPAGPNVDYVPPPVEHLPELLDDFVAFLNRDDIQPIAHAAIAHSRFQEIHPFSDGNGRTGRALTHMLWRRAGLLPNGSCVPVSVPMVGTRDEYIRGLVAGRPKTPLDASVHAFAPIIEHFATAALLATQSARTTATRLLAQVNDYQQHLSFKAHSLGLRALVSLSCQPVVSSASIHREHQNSPDAGTDKRQARRVVERLRERSVLRLVAKRNWERIYVADEFVDLQSDCFRAAVGRHGYDMRIDERDSPSRLPSDEDDMKYRFLCSLPVGPCDVWMPKARKRCSLAAGHAGPHRSAKPWLRRSDG